MDVYFVIVVDKAQYEVHAVHIVIVVLYVVVRADQLFLVGVLVKDMEGVQQCKDALQPGGRHETEE